MSLLNPRRSTPSNALLLGSALAVHGALLPVSADAFRSAAEHRTAVVHDTPIELFIHRPPGIRPRGLLLVLHGQRRNAADYPAPVFGKFGTDSLHKIDKGAENLFFDLFTDGRHFRCYAHDHSTPVGRIRFTDQDTFFNQAFHHG